MGQLANMSPQLVGFDVSIFPKRTCGFSGFSVPRSPELQPHKRASLRSQQGLSSLVPSFRQAENYTGNLVMDTNLICSAVFDHGNEMSKNDLSHLEKQ